MWQKLIGGQGKGYQICCIATVLMFIPYVGGMLSFIIGLIVLCQLLPVFFRRYQIPAHEQPNSCAVCCCQVCTLTQVVRHMEDYDAHPEKNVWYECCSETLDVPNPPHYLWKPTVAPQMAPPPPPECCTPRGCTLSMWPDNVVSVAAPPPQFATTGLNASKMDDKVPSM